MQKLLLLALILPLCNCQLFNLNGGGGQLVTLGGNQQYVLIPIGSAGLQGYQQQVSPAISVAPVPAPVPVSYVKPAPRPIQLVAPKPAPVIVPQPRPFVAAVEEYSGPSEPYTFGYQLQDEEGNSASRQESSDGNTVTGSYSYTDIQGLKRTVNYVADENGYRATVETNEPGTANANPADVQINAEEPPAAVVAAYINPQIRRTRK